MTALAMACGEKRSEFQHDIYHVNDTHEFFFQYIKCIVIIVNGAGEDLPQPGGMVDKSIAFSTLCTAGKCSTSMLELWQLQMSMYPQYLMGEKDTAYD